MDSTKSHAETETLRVGDIAPDFALKASNQEEWRLKNFRNNKNVVLAFVPFAFSSVCSIQLPSYEAELGRFKELGAEVVSISMDSPYALDAWGKSMGTSYPLLSDFYPQGKVVDLYGLRHKAGMSNRAVIVIDKEGLVRYIEVLDSPTDLPNNEALLDAVSKL